MNYTGVKKIPVPEEVLAKLWQDKEVDFWDGRLRLQDNQNLYLVCKSDLDSPGSTLAKVSGDKVKLLEQKIPTVSGIKPINKEQTMALDCLLDKEIGIVCLAGLAGSGKTLLALAAGMESVDQGKHDRIIITKPMSEVGKYKMGALPGDMDDKFTPYLENYFSNIEQIVPYNRRLRKNRMEHIRDVLTNYHIDIVPLQVIRGASWKSAFVIADEVQVLPHHEVLTLGTRLGEGSKLVLMGDLDQRDDRIPKDKTGLYELFNSPVARRKRNLACIELIKCVRSEIAETFIEIFSSR